jgi:hypothetical protein
MSAEPSEQAADPGSKRSNENTFLSLTQEKKKKPWQKKLLLTQ